MITMDDNDFIRWLVDGRLTTIDGEEISPPECFYKKMSGEINAEKIMMVVLKARSLRKKGPRLRTLLVEKNQ